MFLGDFNAAPPNGRYAYAKWSSAAKEDTSMDAWMCTAGRIDILSRAQPQPTWKEFEGPQDAALDRVLMPRDSALSLNMQIHWPQPSQGFDHALIVTRLHHSIAGIGFAGASLLESEDVLPPRARPVSMSKNCERRYQNSNDYPTSV